MKRPTFFCTKLDEMHSIRIELNEYIFFIFNKYLCYFGINFSHPDETWAYVKNERSGKMEIIFKGYHQYSHGTDDVTLEIPIDYFDDFNAACEEHELRVARAQAIANAAALAKQQQTEIEERKQLQALKQKYENNIT